MNISACFHRKKNRRASAAAVDEYDFFLEKGKKLLINGMICVSTSML